MDTKRKFDPDKIIDYSKDYYAILGLERGCLPVGNSPKTRKEIADILQRAWRNQAIRSHPDKYVDENGNKDDSLFKLGVQAHFILGDSILRQCYESGGKNRLRTVEDGTDDWEIDWGNLGNYRKGTLADTTGYEIYLELSLRAEGLGLIPAFCPKDENDNYEWDFVIKDTNMKLAVSIVYDENDVLRLTDGSNIENSLPFKIYICIPRGFLYFARGADEKYVHNDGTVDIMAGKLHGAVYSDYNLLETTLLEDAYKYIEENGKLEKDLEAFRNGTLTAEQEKLDLENNQAKWLSTDRVKELDAETLRNVIKMGTHKTVFKKDAADFLERI